MPRLFLTGFTPNQISGLKAWFRADTIVGSDGGSLSSWADSSGTGNTVTAGSAPTYKTNIINGLPIVRFDGVANVLTKSSPSGFSTGDTPFSVAAVIAFNKNNAYQSFVGVGADSPTTSQWFVGTNNGIPFNFNFGVRDVGSTAGPITGATGQFYIFVGTYNGSGNGGQFILRINGLPGPSLSLGAQNLSNTKLSVGISENFAYAQADIAEIAVFNKALNPQELMGMELYYANKYNLGSFTLNRTTSGTRIIPTTIAQDNFNRADNAVLGTTQTGQFWQSPSTIQIVSNQANDTQTLGVIGGDQATFDHGTSDCTLSCIVKLASTSTNGTGLYVRGNYVILAYPSELQIWNGGTKVVNTAYTGGNLSTGVNYTLTCVLSGTSISATLQNSSGTTLATASYTSTTNQNSSLHGIRFGSGQDIIDNYLVTVPILNRFSLQRNFGSAGNFNGTDNYVDVGSPSNNSLDFALTNSFTIGAWFKWSSSGEQKIISKYGGNALWELTTLSSNNVGLELRGSDGAGLVSVGTLGTVNDGIWHQIIAVRDYSARQIKVYLDGKLNNIGTEALTATMVNSSNCNIGRRNNNTLFFNGIIDEVRVYNRALSFFEVLQLYNQTDSTINPVSSGLASYWKFDENTGTNVADNSSNANTGTWNGTLSSQWIGGVTLTGRTNVT